MNIHFKNKSGVGKDLFAGAKLETAERFSFIPDAMSKQCSGQHKIQSIKRVPLYKAKNAGFYWTLVLRQKHDCGLEELVYGLCRRQEQGKGPERKTSALKDDQSV